ncbi:MAG: AraC family transcriptional regulator [Rhodospirillaceae bacterium]|nr:AraC family transcriptional regulator [Rhodospirillaceae bacterium]|tara:strand:+ start:7026 stop:7973 length:948 start_codon:yes stop_codon:yes gene_type:complete
MDLLSDILGLMKLSGTLYFRTSFTAPWGVEVPSFENIARFHYVHRGRCYARVAGEDDARLLEQGDLIIIPHGATHILSDPVDVDAPTVDQVVEQSGFTGQGALVVGEPGSGHESQLICGHFAFETEASHILVDALPRFIHIKEYGQVSPGWLDDTLKVIGAEAGGDQLGSDLIALKLSEIIFTQAVRHYLAHEGSSQKGLAGFADPNIRQALEAIHQEPAAPWTVETLAQKAGMSRTSFANRFSDLTTYTPLNYLTSWRMQIARKLLADSDLPIIEVATQAGYQSEASFGRTFKRHIGQPPASYRRSKMRVIAAS